MPKKKGKKKKTSGNGFAIIGGKLRAETVERRNEGARETG